MGEGYCECAFEGAKEGEAMTDQEAIDRLYHMARFPKQLKPCRVYEVLEMWAACNGHQALIERFTETLEAADMEEKRRARGWG